MFIIISLSSCELRTFNQNSIFKEPLFVSHKIVLKTLIVFSSSLFLHIIVVAIFDNNSNNKSNILDSLHNLFSFDLLEFVKNKILLLSHFSFFMQLIIGLLLTNAPSIRHLSFI